MKKKGIRYKQYISDLIDISLCISPAIISFFITDVQKYFNYLGILVLLSIIYFFYCILILFSSKGRTVGNAILRIKLINSKTGERTFLNFY